MELQAATGDLIWPDTTSAWVASLLLGIGPYGIGFIGWGFFVRNGDPQVIPIIPYKVPLATAITLVLAGQSQPTLSLFVSCLRVTAACMAVTFLPQFRN